MAETRKVRITARVGDPSNGAILQPGAVVVIPAYWADRYIAQGAAEIVAEEVEKPKADEKRSGKKK